MRTRAVFFALLFSFCTSHAIEVQQKGADVTASEMTADALLKQADETFQSSDYKAALEQYQSTVEKSREEFNHSVEVEALSQVARMHLILGDKEEGRKWLKEAEAKVTDSDPMGWSRYLGVRGRFEWKDNDLKAARKTFDEMYEYCNVNTLWGRAVDQRKWNCRASQNVRFFQNQENID
jgi:tetratricopeptide (TPR) repeat protein